MVTDPVDEVLFWRIVNTGGAMFMTLVKKSPISITVSRSGFDAFMAFQSRNHAFYGSIAGIVGAGTG